MALADKLRTKAAEPVDRGDPIIFSGLDGVEESGETIGDGSLNVDLDAPLGGKITTVADDDADGDPFATDKPRSIDRDRSRTADPDDAVEPRDNFLIDQEGDPLDEPVDAPRRRDDRGGDVDLTLDEDLRQIPNKDLARQLQSERVETAQLKDQAAQTRVRDFETRKTQVNGRLAAINTRLTAIETEMEAAAEAGESKTVVKLTREMAGLEAEKQTATNAKSYLDSQPAPKATAVADRPANGKDVPLIGTPVNKLAASYADRNPWLKDSRFAKQHATFKAIDEALFDEGKDPSTPGYYVELDRRTRAIYPTLPGTPMRGGEGNGQRGRQPVSQNGTSGDPPPARPAGTGGRVSITPEDRHNMERFGLDPRKKQDIVAYANEKRSLTRAEQARGRR